MIRKIITIDEDKCNGCGLCANACHEKAIDIVDGKAKLMREHFCDGLGDCLPACPMNAISFEEREAPEYDEASVKENQKKSSEKQLQKNFSPGNMLSGWPIQIKLVPEQSMLFNKAHILIAADCTAYAYENFSSDFINGKTVIIGCPKLDAIDYSIKLASIIKNNEIQSITVVKMEVPCCTGMELATKKALSESGKDIPLIIKTISINGLIK